MKVKTKPVVIEAILAETYEPVIDVGNQPYAVEVDGCPCSKCGRGGLYNVVYTPEDVALSVTYYDREEAELIAEQLNDAFQNGVSKRNGK